MPRPGDAPRRSPDVLERLTAIALDIHWAWNHAGDGIWRRLDDELWERTKSPWLLLQHVGFDRLERLAEDPAFVEELQALEETRERYRVIPPWRPAGVTSLPTVAYFSMEFGLTEALPLYAGGLGVLAGDYLKTASDLHTPIVGVGIMWQQGYFRQVLDRSGGQTELYPFNEPASLPVRPVVTAGGERLQIPLMVQGRTVLLRAWQLMVGRTTLYLLDSNDAYNAPADRGLTATLYGGSPEVRLLQEIILGIGGWRLLVALGHDVEICHLNEGHAAFVVVERARHVMQRLGMSFHEALWATRAGNVFTTHTAVPAGFDTFPADDIEVYRAWFEDYVRSLGLEWNELLALGRRDPDDEREPFSMAWLAMRGCSRVNGVSRLHGEVSRRLFAGLFPRWPEAEVPVAHITNGVHVPSWDSPWTDEIWTRLSGRARWCGDVSALAGDILQLDDDELWQLLAHERADLVRYARARLLRKLARHVSQADAARTARSVLDPEVLTLGFARRFATYKRPNLLLTDPSRLLALLTNPHRPVQLIVAGKAHPRDVEGKALIQEWTRFAARPEARNHVVFLDDYDIRLATELVQGVDVWINTPRRPWEASGTSGMKVLVNGGLNLSTLDGWWAEAFSPDWGWAVGDATDRPADDARDAAELYATLEDDVIPRFYERDGDGLPRRWLALMRASMASLAPRFSSARMLQEYVEQCYVPAAASYRERMARDGAVARALSSWSSHLDTCWGAVRIGDAAWSHTADGRVVSVPVWLGPIDPGSVRVELYADPLDGSDRVVETMRLAGAVEGQPQAYVYEAIIASSRPNEHFTPRVVPYHPSAQTPIEAPHIAWAR